MNSPDVWSLVDWAPTLRLLLLGAVIASVPLAWLWLRHRKEEPLARAHALVLLTAFLTFDLIVFGSFTRLSDSGLGCPDWPGCYGEVSPFAAKGDIAAAEKAMPDGPVTWNKAWIEMIHRYFAMAVGGLILVITAWAWIDRSRTKMSPWWASFILAWVLMQGAFGKFTVTMKLFPAIVTLHLLGGIGLLVLLRHLSLKLAKERGLLTPWNATQGLKALAAATAAALLVQIALGGWVSTNYAVLACTEFPKCHGSWWPDMNFVQGFEVWRELGKLQSGESVSFQALTAIHYTHRLMAYLVFALFIALGWQLTRQVQSRRLGQLLWALAAWQLISGLSNVVLGWPLIAALAHSAGAAAMALVMTDVVFRIRAEVRT